MVFQMVQMVLKILISFFQIPIFQTLEDLAWKLEDASLNSEQGRFKGGSTNTPDFHHVLGDVSALHPPTPTPTPILTPVWRREMGKSAR